MGEMRDSDWSRQNFLRSDWLLPTVAMITTKNDEDSGRSSKMTPSYKWPIEIAVTTEANKDQSS